MSRIRVPSLRLLGCGISILLTVAPGSPLVSQSISASSHESSSAITEQSDAAAIQAMRNVIAKSGGLEAWRGLRSAKETFSILGAGESTPQVLSFLNDWSQETTRYRHKMRGQSGTPHEHNGAATFAISNGTSQLTVPEFDQAKTLVGLLPAAAAEVMLRRSEYVLKISNTQTCKNGDTCVDVYRASHSTLPSDPDQQWKISATTGLPITIRYQTTTVGRVTAPIWREVYFLRYTTEDKLVIPASLGMSLRGKRQTWTFVSLEKNPGFDTAKFDQEAAQ